MRITTELKWFMFVLILVVAAALIMTPGFGGWRAILEVSGLAILAGIGILMDRSPEDPFLKYRNHSRVIPARLVARFKDKQDFLERGSGDDFWLAYSCDIVIIGDRVVKARNFKAYDWHKCK